MPTAFVLMPFDERLKPVYTLVVKPALEAAGYDVHRADDLSHAQNIMRDVIEGIEEANVLVADLTGSNPNVYLEAGMAFGLSRPVILLAQDIGDVPFDLHQYRVLEYSADLEGAEKLRADLRTRAEAAINGELRFGSPISDFLGLPIRYHDSDVDDKGFLDIMAEMEEGLEDLSDVTHGLTETMVEMAEEAGEASEGLRAVKQGDIPRPMRSARGHAQKYAAVLVRATAVFSNANSRHEALYPKLSSGLELLTTAAETQPFGPEEVTATHAFIDQLRCLSKVSLDASAELSSLMATTGQLRGMEQSLSAAASKLKKEGKAFSRKLEGLVTLLESTVAKLQRRLDEAEQG